MEIRLERIHVCRSEQWQRHLHPPAIPATHQGHLTVVVHRDRLRSHRLPRRSRYVHHTAHRGISHQHVKVPPGDRVLLHLVDPVLHRRRRGCQGAVATKLRHGEFRYAPGKARTDVPFVDRRDKAAAGVGEEEELRVVLQGGLAPGGARPSEHDDDGESWWRVRQGCAVGFP